MDMRVMFATLLFLWICNSCVNGNSFPWNLHFNKTVSPFKCLLDVSMMQTTFAKSQTQCATMCAYESGCESFTFMNGGVADSHCYNPTYHDYTGTRNITYTGRTCQRWDSQSPHAHDYTNIDDFHGATLADAANYCRDPGNDGLLWCYTTDAAKRWDMCDIAKCMGPTDNCRLFGANELTSQQDYTGFNYFKVRGISESRCYNQSSHAYAGTWDITYTGRTCQRWDSQSPHTHDHNNIDDFPEATLADAANYCRDPGNDGYLWCYTIDPNFRYEPCGVHQCYS